MKRKARVLLVSLLALAMLLTACGQKPAGVAAKVDGEEIPMEEFQREYWTQRNLIVNQYGEAYLKEKVMQGKSQTVDEALKEMVLKNLEQLKMVEQDSKDAKIEIKDADVDRTIENMKAQYGGEENFKKALEAENMTEDFLRKNIKNRMMMEKYYTHLQDQVKVTDKDLEKYYKDHQDELAQVDASHILVKTEKEAKEIEKKLKGGAKFEDLAKEKSIDKASGENGGSLGYFGKGQMVKEFEDKAFSMKKGEISEPVKSQFGYHIIKINDVKNSFKDVKDNIKDQVKQEKVKEELRRIENNKKVKTYVDLKEEVPLPKGMEKITKKGQNNPQGQEQDQAQNTTEENKKAE